MDNRVRKDVGSLTRTECVHVHTLKPFILLGELYERDYRMSLEYIEEVSSGIQTRVRDGSPAPLRCAALVRHSGE